MYQKKRHDTHSCAAPNGLTVSRINSIIVTSVRRRTPLTTLVFVTLLIAGLPLMNAQVMEQPSGSYRCDSPHSHQSHEDYQHFCGMQPRVDDGATLFRNIAPHGGAYLPTKGFIRGMVIFAQTQNDNLQSATWPLGELPLWADEYAERVRRYFHDMSWGELELQLDIHPRCMITANTEDGYVYWKRNFGDAIKEFIDSLDAIMTFDEYDLWTSQSSMYKLRSGPDGQVDLLVVIFRRTTNVYFLPFAGVSDLGFSGYKFVDGSLDRWFYGGSGMFNDASASGVTLCRRPGYGVITDAEYAFIVGVHEIGHKLLGDGHPAEAFGGLGIMANAGNGYAMNSFERQLAGYIDFRELRPYRDTTVVLRDYVTTGDALLLPLPEAFRSYYSFEFRNRTSEWDSAPIQGLYAYRIYDSPGYTSKTVQVESAEGRYDWALDSASMKVFPLRPNPLAGYTRFQRIPLGGRSYFADGYWGDERSAFTLRRREFSVLKNPTPDFIFGSDTIRTGLRIMLLEMDDSSATLQFSYQEPAILSIEAPSSDEFSLSAPYPLPVRSGSLLRIPLRSSKALVGRLALYDQLGRRILQRDDVQVRANGEIQLLLRDIPPGMYTLVFDANATLHRLRIPVIRH
jgi:hypothetical protein